MFVLYLFRWACYVELCALQRLLYIVHLRCAEFCIFPVVHSCAQLCMLVLYLFRCACYVELRALQRWSAAISPRAGFRRQRHRFYLAALCHSAAVCCVLCSLWNYTLLCVSDTLQWWLAPTLLYIGETGRGGDGGGVFRGRANNNWRTQSQPAQNQPLTASHVTNFGKSLGGMISTD